jgi:hypothetical protein
MPTGDRRRRTTRTTVTVVTLALVAGTAACAPVGEAADQAAGVPAHLREPAPTPTTGPTATSPYASMWLWENPVHLTTDARGRGYSDAAPDVVARFAAAQGLTTVHVATPWASDTGEVADWVDATTAALHDEGIRVSVLGGDTTWLADPSLGATWTRDALRARNVDRVQLSLEPWAQPLWQTDLPRAVAQWQAAMDAVRAELPAGVTLGIDAPYWLASTSAGPHRTLFDSVLARADHVAIVAFRDVAEGDDGILALSAAARRQAEDAGVPYTIALETDSPRVTGGAECTFFDDGAAVLDEQARIVDDALRGDEHYAGVAVERFRTWRDLVDPPAERYAG